MKTIPVNTPKVGYREIFNVMVAAFNKELSGESSVVTRVENELSQYFGGAHVALVSNGTVALELAFQSIELSPGDEVILPTLTIASCLLPIVKIGALPIFVDSDSETWQPNIEEIKAKINKRTKAILYVHLYGFGADLSALTELCRTNGIILIEDCAQAFGLKISNTYAGSFGDLTTFSFYPNKVITAGEGGAVVSNNSFLIERVKKLRNLSFNREKRFIHDEFSSNSRMSGLQAAILSAQLSQVETFLNHRRRIAEYYFKELQDLPIKFQTRECPGIKNTWWVVGIQIPEHGKESAELIEILLRNGVQTRPFFFPLHLQPALNRYYPNGLPSISLPLSENAQKLYRFGLYLPGGNGMRLKNVAQVCQRFRYSYKDFATSIPEYYLYTLIP